MCCLCKRYVCKTISIYKKCWMGFYLFNGYKLIYKPEHKRANHAGYVYEHNLVMEKHLGRELKFFGYKNKNNEVCHHIDRNKLNNDISNLQLMTEKEHFELHKKEDEYSLKVGRTRSSFDESDANKIREIYKTTNKSQCSIAKDYGVSQSVISNIINKRRKCYGK